MSDTAWTESETITLKRLVAEGLSSTQIAGQLPGRNKNKVAGKVNRMCARDSAWPRLSDTSKINTPNRLKATARYKSGENMPRSDDIDKAALDQMFKRGQRIAPWTPVADPVREDDIRASRITVLDLRENMCRYAIDAPAGEKLSFFFCGEETAVNRSWCAHHFKMTHNQNAQRRV